MTEFLVRVAVPDYIRTVDDFNGVVVISTHVEGDLPYKVIGCPPIERKVYRGTKEHSDMLAARFASSSNISFGFDGHRWQYDHSAFDDKGEYDLIYRLAP